MKRTEKAIDDTSVTGYIQSVSSLKKAKNNGTIYFDGVVQTNNQDTMRFVSFSPEKLESFQSAHTMKSPVKITNPKLTPTKGKTEITVQKNSNLEVCQKLRFSFKETVTETSPEAKVGDLTAPSKKCTVSVKVIDVTQAENIDTMYGKRMLAVATIADETGNMKLPLWSNNIEKVQLGKSYKISNLFTKSFKSEMQLNTTSNTTFEPIKDIENPVEEIAQKPLIQIKGRVTLVQIQTTRKCLQCHKVLDLDESQQQGNLYIRCPNCKVKQRLNDVGAKKMAKLQVADENQIHNFVVFDDVLMRYCQAKQLLTENDDELEDHFLQKEEITIKCIAGNDIAEVL